MIMKLMTKLFILCISMGIIASCSDDDENDFLMPASLKVVNAINGEPSVIVNTAGDSIVYATTRATVGFGASRRLTIPTNRTQELEIVSAADTLDIIYNEVLELQPSIYTLFLVGEDGSEENLFVEDDFKQFTDSIVGVRFAHLSPNGSTLNVSVVDGSGNTTENLGYKGVTEYFEFPAKNGDGPYTFEFKDAGGNVLTTSIVDPLQNRNVSSTRNLTLAIIGLDDTALSVARINNY